MQTEILQNIGLTEGEIRVYLALIKLGPSTTGPIVDRSEVSSSKIYNILERLIQKGLISYTIKEKTRHYQAENPLKIKNYIDKKEKSLQQQKKEINKLIPELQQQMQTQKTIAEAQIYKGFKGIQTIIDNSYNSLKKGETFYALGIPSYQEPKYHEYWSKEDHPRRIKLGIKVKLLFNLNTPKEVLKNRNSFWGSEARYMPIPIETPSWILIYKDTAVIILQGDEPMAIEITNPKIAHSFKEYFDAFWKISKPFK
jgi:HTH-type transcriptional regulator, sugar sensing transcriptional regulator